MWKSKSRNIDMASRRSYLWLAIGVILLVISSGKWVVPAATWLAPVFIMRFLRTQKAVPGLATGAILYILASLIMWGEMLMPDGWAWYPILLISGLGLAMFSPYLIDRMVSPRLDGFVVTLVFPLGWTTAEYVLSLASPYATFSSLAYTQYGNLPLMQLVSVTGIWGIPLLITWFAAVVNWIWESEYPRARLRCAFGIYGIILIAVLLLGGVRLTIFAPGEETVRVASVTTAPDYRIRLREVSTLSEKQVVGIEQRDLLLEQSRRAARLGAGIVFWQEYAVALVSAEEAFIIPGRQLARDEQIYLGMAYSTVARNENGDPASPGERATPPENKIVMIDPSGAIIWEYLKANPIPGEGIMRGNGIIPVRDTPYGRLASVICFDLDFPGFILQAGRDDVDILLAPSYDWKEIVPLSTHVAVFRAVENGCSLIRCTGHGLSIATDYQGRVRSSVDYFTSDQRVMIADVPVGGVATLYSLIGDLFAWLCAAGLVAVIGCAVFRRNPR
ncbi:MAG: hypothetical protein JSV44_11970 [Candidatus Zixiibacteriota bacterium]|nr:MAG: hypothetical protein JSV44_11970 [candidate division Zixibacteria bacterium]